MNLSLTAQTAATSSMTKRLGLALQALEAVIWRLLGIPLNPPFRNFTTFRSYWIREGASGHGGWQARRDIVEGLLDPFRQELTRQRRSGIPQISVALIATLRDPAAIREQLGRLQGIAQSDPPLAIGTAKELVESTAKMVLQERGLQSRRQTGSARPDQTSAGRARAASGDGSAGPGRHRGSQADPWWPHEHRRGSWRAAESLWHRTWPEGQASWSPTSTRSACRQRRVDAGGNARGL